ncbi:ABC transporter permease [Phytoactinopolyspora halotolerans]|uniref:ABC transporter permease n=1 Tax=Phytoactinopolyspora halotolerans TaxID=1981512 RepID=A0A6L9SFN5_9ACTN|nr:ABC transporter permease [Phytoactinopolyspora halotolerans]NEE03251.1 ABC transporter permease [Phytoactinopolyspora halotolerans]
MTGHLTWTELKLLVREPLVLILSLMFPILLMVLLVTAFRDHTGSVFADLDGDVFYVTAYLGAAVAVMGFMGTPTHLAGYRESGVLRRFRAAGVGAPALVVSQTAVLAVLAVVGAAAMIVLAYAGFNLAAPASIGGVVAAFAAGVLAFAGIGTFLGSVMPSARAAQGLGLLLFLGTFLLVGGGPPPGVLPGVVNDIAAWTPIGLLIDAIRAPWADGALDGPAMAVLVAIATVGFALATRRLRRT